MDSNTSNTNPSLSASYIFQHPVAILSFIILALSFVLNTIYIIMKHKSGGYKTNLDMIYLSLSIANITVALCGVGSFVIIATVDMRALQLKLYTAFNNFASIWQSCLLLGIAIDRYIAIMKPLHYTQLINKTKLLIYIVISAIFAAAFGSCVLLVSISEHVDQSRLSLYEMFGPEAMLFQRIWLSLHIFIGICIFGLYIPVLMAIRHQLKRDSEGMKKHHGTIKLCIVIVYFYLSWPFLILQFSVAHFYNMPFNDIRMQIMSFLSHMFAFSSSFVNPLIYGMNVSGFYKKCARNRITACN